MSGPCAPEESKACTVPRTDNMQRAGLAVLILALDTTTRTGSVALVRGGVLLHEHSGDPSRTHGQRLPGELMTACEAAGVAVRDVELFAVAAGPGSFTGLRIGIAATQGLATAYRRRIVPVSTLEALAVTTPPEATRAVVWMDAQRGQVFAQVFELERTQAIAVARPLADAVAATPAEALETHAGLVDGATFVGDGALRYRDVVAAALGDVVAAAVPPLAGAVARIAARHPERSVVPHAVIPLYVRRPDAEIARDRRASPS